MKLQVLEHVREKTGVGESREWTLIGCDGLPYTLASRIIGTNNPQNIKAV